MSTTTIIGRDQLPVMIGDTGSGGEQGIVPAPSIGDRFNVLYGNGTWGPASGNIDGGAASTAYLAAQKVEGGSASSTYTGSQKIDAGGA